MGTLQFMWLKYKPKIILGACVIVLLAVAVIIYILSTGASEPEAETGVTEIESGDNQQALISDQKLSGYAEDVANVSPAYDVIMIAKGKSASGESGEWNLVMDKSNGLVKVYKDGEDTGSYSNTELSTEYAIIKLDEYTEVINPASLPVPKIDNAYEVDYTIGLGIAKYFEDTGYEIVLSVESTDYADVYMENNKSKEEDANKDIIRVLVTKDVTFVARGVTEVPSVDNYVNIK